MPQGRRRAPQHRYRQSAPRMHAQCRHITDDPHDYMAQTPCARAPADACMPLPPAPHIPWAYWAPPHAYIHAHPTHPPAPFACLHAHAGCPFLPGGSPRRHLLLCASGRLSKPTPTALSWAPPQTYICCPVLLVSSPNPHLLPCPSEILATWHPVHPVSMPQLLPHPAFGPGRKCWSSWPLCSG